MCDAGWTRAAFIQEHLTLLFASVDHSNQTEREVCVCVCVVMTWMDVCVCECVVMTWMDVRTCVVGAVLLCYCERGASCAPDWL